MADGAGSSGVGDLIGKLFLSLFFLVFLTLGTVFEVLVARSIFEQQRVRTWDAVPCTIVRSEVRKKEAGRYEHDVAYRYEVGGREYRGDRRSLGGFVKDSLAEVQSEVDRLPAGTRTTCLVDPKNPASAVLEAPSPWEVLIALFPLIFVAVGAGGLVFVWRRKGPKRRVDGTLAPVAISSKAGRGKMPRGAMVAFFSLFLLVGLGLTYLLGVRPALKLWEARGWRETPCRILSSEVRSHSDSDGTTYSVAILYEYEAGGRVRQADRYDFMGGSSSGYDGKADVVARYPEGSRATCFVDPEDPAEAVLERGFRAIYLLGLLPLLFAVAGALGLRWVFAGQAGGGGPVGLGAPQELAGPMAGEVRVTYAEAPTGELVLKSKGTPLAKFIAVTVIALFWNGIVSIFLWQVVLAHRRGNADWFETLFLVPFVLVGLALVAGIGYQFLALFNPRVQVTLRTAPLRLGTPEEFSWVVSGAVGRLRGLALTLEGKEEISYRRGTRTYNEKSLFARIPLAEVRSAAEMAQGTGRVALPQGLVPSFGAPSNKITWTLKVAGEIASWPDVDEEFELLVLPQEVGR